MNRALPPRHVEVAIRHPFRMITDALAANLPAELDFQLSLTGDEVPRSADIAILDPQAALELLKRKSLPRCRIIVLAIAAREFEVQRVIQAGAFGFVVLSSAMSEFRECLSAVALGRRYLCKEAALSIVAGMTRDELTPRETAVLALLADGLCNKAIARELEVSDGTIKTHVKAILSKLGAASRTQAARYAIERGFVTH